MEKSKEYEAVVLSLTNSHLFIGKKPIIVLIDGKPIEAKTWRKAFEVILLDVNANINIHEKLMFLRGRASGRVRVFISDKPDKMRNPLKIDENLYFETHYGSETLFHILTKRILEPAGYDYSKIKIVLKEQKL